MTTVLEQALAYAKSGLAVFPCQGKRPITPAGFEDASTVPGVIKAWFSGKDKEGLNVAAVIPKDFVVLDIDGAVGEESLRLSGFHPPFTATVKTPRGRHLWYEWPLESPPLRRVDFLPKVDVLCKGYVLLPPSKNAHGVEYQWESPLSDHVEIAPEWLVTAISEETASREKIDVEEWFFGLPDGSIQTGLFRYACRLRGLPRITKTEAKVLVSELAKRSEDRKRGSYKWDTDAMVERVWVTYDAALPDPPPTEDENRVWSLAELLSESPSAPDYLIDRMIPGIGYSILFAAQGVGKSVLADQMAFCIATGKKIFGRSVKQAGALILDIEQDPASSAQRLRMLMRGLGEESPPANLYTAYSWPLLEEGGFEKLASFLVDHAHVRLVVVDTLAQAMTVSTDGGGNAYFTDNHKMGKFTKFSKDYGVAFLVVHHTRKSNAGSSDTFADASSGSRGITGPAKARLWLNRKEGEDAGTLYIGGKVPEHRMTITFDKDNLVWR